MSLLDTTKDLYLDALETLIQFSPEQGNNVMGNQRITTNPTHAMGILRHDLIRTMGIERTKAFILRYGWNCGVSDGLRIKEMKWASEKDILWAGPKMFTVNGHAYAEPLITKSDFKKGTLHFEGISRNSNEAEQHIKLFGLSDSPVCFTMVGYASGYLSMVMGKQVIVKEIECEGKGDSQCRWVCKTAEEWDEEPTPEIAYFESLNIEDELTKMYDSVKIERDNLQAAIKVHNQLMDQLLNGKSAQSFVDVIYQITNIPVLIEDEKYNQMAATGMDAAEAILHTETFKKQMNQKDLEFKDRNQTIEIAISNEQYRLITPIIVGQSIVGYCSFINTSFKEVDSLILKQLAVICSLYLFNERTVFETEQRLKGSFLEDILNKRLTSQEIYRKANYIGVELGTKYHLFVLEKFAKDGLINEELEMSDENAIPTLSKYYKDRNINILLTQQSQRMIGLLPIEQFEKNFINLENFFEKSISYLEEKFPYCKFVLGVSSKSNDIEKAPNLYEESIAASNLAKQQNKIVFYDDLGIVGVLFQSGKLDNIRDFCNKTLGKIIEYDRSKNSEMTKTLYFYIKNGLNLYQTARDINLSIGGMRYRLQKLNEILEVDINDPQNSFQIYLALQSMVVLGDLDIHI